MNIRSFNGSYLAMFFLMLLLSTTSFAEQINIMNGEYSLKLTNGVPDSKFDVSLGSANITCTTVYKINIYETDGSSSTINLKARQLGKRTFSYGQSGNLTFEIFENQTLNAPKRPFYIDKRCKLELSVNLEDGPTFQGEKNVRSAVNNQDVLLTQSYFPVLDPSQKNRANLLMSHSGAGEVVQVTPNFSMELLLTVGQPYRAWDPNTNESVEFCRYVIVDLISGKEVAAFGSASPEICKHRQ